MERPYNTCLKLLAVVAFMGISCTARGQSVMHSNEQWTQYYLNAELNTRFLIASDAGLRWRELYSKSSQYIFRMGPAYKFNEKYRASIAFAIMGMFMDSHLTPLMEFRIHEEMTQRSGFKKFILSQRFRIEERFFSPIEEGKHTAPCTFQLRMRYFINFKIPVWKQPHNGKRKFVVNMGNEIFLRRNNTVNWTTFDQNRVLIGPAFEFGPRFSIAFLWQSRYTADAAVDTYKYTDVFWLQVKQTFGKPQKDEISKK